MLLKQSTTANRLFFMVSSTDHLSAKTGLTVTVNLSKDGAAFGAAAGAVTEIANGWYKVALTAADTGTLGELAFHCTATGADDTDFADQVVAFDPTIAWPDAAHYTNARGDNLANLDATVSSRSAPATAQTIDQTTALPGSPGAGSIGEALKFADTRLDAAVSTRLAASGVPTNFSALAITVGGAVTAGTVSDKTGYALTAGEETAIANALLDLANAIETGLTMRQGLRLALAVLAGKVSGGGTGTEVFRNAVADTKARVTATDDASGNRTAITYDVA